jgi:hypothetical protein
MYHRNYTITPSQEATNGALCIFVEGCRKDNVRQQLFGLAVLRCSTEAQIQTAMPFAQQSQGVSGVAIQEMLAR